jgi:hypothetical protein
LRAPPFEVVTAATGAGAIGAGSNQRSGVGATGASIVFDHSGRASGVGEYWSAGDDAPAVAPPGVTGATGVTGVTGALGVGTALGCVGSSVITVVGPSFAGR